MKEMFAALWFGLFVVRVMMLWEWMSGPRKSGDGWVYYLFVLFTGFMFVANLLAAIKEIVK